MNRMLPCSVFLVLAGCNKLSDEMVTSGVAVLIGDTPQNDLSSLELMVTDIELVAGDRAEPLLSKPVEVELIDLETRRSLIALLEIPRGSYDRVRVTIDPASVRARDRFGVPVTLNVGRSSDAFVVKNDIDVERSQVTQVAIDVLLNESLHERKDGFDFELTIEAAGMNREIELAELRGRVVGVDAAVQRVDVEILASDEDALSRGQIQVDVGSSILLGDRGDRLPADDFLDELQDGDIVEVYASLTEEHFLIADAVEIQAKKAAAARIEGTVISVDTQGNTLGLRIRDVRSGEDVVHDKIGNQPDIVVSWSEGTVMVVHDDRRDGRSDDQDDGGEEHGSAGENDLAVGQEVDIEFREFETEPFASREIEIQDQRPVFEGRLVAIDGLPKNLVMRLEPFSPAVVSGLVESSDTDVSVSVKQLRTNFLDLPDEPLIDKRELEPNLRVAFRGELSGPPDAPVIKADILKVTPGMLRGELSSFDAESGTGTVAISEQDDPFGDVDLDGSFHFDQDVRFEGDIDSEAALEQLWVERRQGEHVLVTIAGLADPTGSINVYLLRASRAGGD